MASLRAFNLLTGRPQAHWFLQANRLFQRCHLGNCSSYHSVPDDTPTPYTAAESAILAAALIHVPAHGFTPSALANGAQDAGYIAASANLFPRGTFDLVHFHLATQRRALQQDIDPESTHHLGVTDRVRLLLLRRLRANGNISSRWQEALAIMTQPQNVGTSLAEMARLVDEIWYLAGDMSVDTSWYTKRASLAAVYASTELFMTTDRSPDYVETERFLDRRLASSRRLGEAVDNVEEWLGFTGSSFLNLLRSKGMRI